MQPGFFLTCQSTPLSMAGNHGIDWKTHAMDWLGNRFVSRSSADPSSGDRACLHRSMGVHGPHAIPFSFGDWGQLSS
jgi:hypothetical protein